MNVFVNATVVAALMVSSAPAGAEMAVTPIVAPAAVAQPAVSAVTTATVPKLLLKSGTAIPLVAASTLTSKSAKIGDSITMKVAQDVVVGGEVVIPADTIAVGEVTGVRTRGMLCRTGKIDATLRYVDLGGEHIPLTMAVTVKGSGAMGAAGAIAGFIAFGPLAAVITGKSAAVTPGMKVNGKIVGDVAMAAVRHPSTTARASL